MRVMVCRVSCRWLSRCFNDVLHSIEIQLNLDEDFSSIAGIYLENTHGFFSFIIILCVLCSIFNTQFWAGSSFNFIPLLFIINSLFFFWLLFCLLWLISRKLTGYTSSSIWPRNSAKMHFWEAAVPYPTYLMKFKFVKEKESHKTIIQKVGENMCSST